ncbi:hypothetical protein [Methanocaldococcus sp.]
MKLLKNGRLEKIHYLIYLLTNGDKKRWVRQEVVFGVIYYLTKKGIFDYIFSPSPYYWVDGVKFINYSYEVLNDINILVNEMYLNEILLSVRGFSDFIVGYGINKTLEYNFKEKEEINKILLDENGELKKISLTSNGIVIGDESVDLTEFEKVDYNCKAYNLKVSIWESKI